MVMEKSIPTEIIIKNIPVDWDEFDLFRVFSLAGIVYDIKLPPVPANYSTRFGFVKYRLPSEAILALNKFNRCSEIKEMEKKLKTGFDVKLVQDGYSRYKRREKTWERNDKPFEDDENDDHFQEIEEAASTAEISSSKENSPSGDLEVSKEPFSEENANERYADESEQISKRFSNESASASKHSVNSVKVSTRCTVCRKPCEKGCPCKEAFYCGPECQKKDWQSHQEDCAYYNGKL